MRALFSFVVPQDVYGIIVIRRRKDILKGRRVEWAIRNAKTGERSCGTPAGSVGRQCEQCPYGEQSGTRFVSNRNAWLG